MKEGHSAKTPKPNTSSVVAKTLIAGKTWQQRSTRGQGPNMVGNEVDSKREESGESSPRRQHSEAAKEGATVNVEQVQMRRQPSTEGEVVEAH